MSRLKGFVTMSSDIGYMVPAARPNLPSTDYINNGIYLGRSQFHNFPVCLDFSNLLSPTGILVGKIRTGKSTTAKAILIRLNRLYGTRVLIFDPHGEYAELVRSNGGIVIDMKEEKINPCQLGEGSSLTQKAHQLVDMLGTVFDLNYNQVYYFTKYAVNGFKKFGNNLTFNYIIDQLEQDSKRDSMLAKSVRAILTRIGLLSDTIFGDANSIPISSLTQGLVCVDLSRLDNNTYRDIAMLSILQYIYNDMLANQGRPSQINDKEEAIRLEIMIDEAGRVAADEKSVAARLVKESGKFKIGLMFGIQDLADLDTKIFSNYGFMIVHKLDNSDYISKIQKDANFTRGQSHLIQSLPVGTAYVKLNFKDAAVSRPFLVNVDQELPLLGTITESKVEQNLGASKPLRAQIPEIRTNRDTIGKVRDSPKLDNNLQQNKETTEIQQLQRKLAQDLIDNPSFNVTQHYDSIGVDSYRGNDAKKSLSANGYIKETYLKNKGKILHLTKTAIEEMGLKPATDRFGGGVHINVIDNIATKLRDIGHSVETEKKIGENSYTDIVVDSKTAVEVEMREFRHTNIYKNVGFFEKVIIVCYKKSQLDNFKTKLNNMPLSPERRKKVTVIDYPSLCRREKLLEVFGDARNTR
ncbi:MAG: DUF87 domain-containing protein [Nitrosopumilaceae archaeon]|nr:ATP-binding protein [Nitrosopumilaceae archaeon]NIU01290.1 ATP-binding protein [Nitrosopumilaceae archaeon]NIU87638.1 DUF87 domain-containing protein [Nitrosopumilaceae archaeon]NIV66063.1 DUF87 domain-containing protein [Nitrosopumilaceae archaeon]NIX61892.1 DUF87 domain-containing protein [Nitrosopumilaceae archaeon]